MLYARRIDGWPWAAIVLLAAALCLWNVGSARAEDDTDADPPASAPRPMAEVAAELADLEAKVAGLDQQVDEIRKGRLAEINGEYFKLNGEISKAKGELQRIEDRIRRGIAGKYEKELNKAKRDRDAAYKAATDKLNNYKRQYSKLSGTPQYAQYVKVAEQTCTTEKETARTAYEKKRDDLKRQYDAEVDKAKDAASDEVDRHKSTVSTNEETLKTLTQERGELVKKIADLQKESQPLERQATALRREAAERPDEAIAAGLWPRNGRYAVDEETGKLVINGGVWGKPTDSEAWKSSNQVQANTLLSLAKQKIEAGDKDMARKCLELIQQKFASTTAAGPAKTLLDEL